tara:strand:- start:6745 stop:7458 length:714 start_codon:yes stop_codon:yes gene_type:complete
MKRIYFLIAILFLSFTSFAQDKVEWLSLSAFEKAVKKGSKNCFVFIEGGEIGNKDMPKERLEEMKKYLFRFMEDKDVIKYLNQNFICYKFNAEGESLNFQGNQYGRNESTNTHEFTDFLTGGDAKSLPLIVLRDKNFNLFEYQATTLGASKELQVLIDAEELKYDYIMEKLGPDHNVTKSNLRMIEKKKKQLDMALQNNMRKSIFRGRQNPNKILKTLTFFGDGFYKEKDIESFLQK